MLCLLGCIWISAVVVASVSIVTSATTGTVSLLQAKEAAADQKKLQAEQKLAQEKQQRIQKAQQSYQNTKAKMAAGTAAADRYETFKLQADINKAHARMAQDRVESKGVFDVGRGTRSTGRPAAS